MSKLLHIIATPRQEKSRTLKVSTALLDALKQKNSDIIVDELDLFKDPLPSLTLKQIDGKYILLSGKELEGEQAESWKAIVQYIEQFLSADTVVISTPFWNFSIPYVLKQYIDIILQPKYLFHYTANGPEGLATNKKMIIVTSRGGDYSPGSPAQAMDHQEGYLKTVFNFAGINDIHFIHAQPMDAGGPDVQKEKIQQAMQQAQALAESV